MKESYFYANGRRVPVTKLESARVVRVPEDREPVSVPGWHEVPLGSQRFQLLVRADAVSERSARAGVQRLEDLAVPLLEAERATAAGLQRLQPRLAAEAGDGSVPRLEAVALSVAADGNDERSAATALLAELSYRDVVGEQPRPALVGQDGALLLPTGEVAVRFRDGRGRAAAERAVLAHGGRIVRESAVLTGTYVAEPLAGGDGLDLANALVESGEVEFASPNFIEEMPFRQAGTPPNALFAQQWHLHNPGLNGARAGADVRAVDAWKITRGSADVVICIIDSGVDSRHEAFSAPGKLVPGFDFDDEDAFPDPTVSSHGTSCAGVAAAPWGRGRVVGIAPDCRIMPIRRSTLSEHLKMAEAFAWASAHGADVISCSFGYDNRPWILPDVVRSAIDGAVRTGRGGRGCVVVWAAGNGSEPVATDEWASNPNVIAVAASTDQDVRAPYSDYGPQLHVCAPSNGGSGGITTTSNGGYTNAFGGTSSSAPLVAGVVGLLLSVNPNLTWREVRDLLRDSAEKIDPANGRYDPSGHSPWYGYGRVNAHRALLAISPLAEAVRGTDVEARLPAIRAFARRYLEPRPAGQVILRFLQSQQFTILALLRSGGGFRANAVAALRATAAFAEAVQAGRGISISDATWQAVAAIARQLLPASLPDAERNFHAGEVIMARKSSESGKQEYAAAGPDNGDGGVAAALGERAVEDIDDVLKKLADIIGGRVPAPAPAPAPPPVIAPPAPVPTGTLSEAQREEVARLCYFNQGVPVLNAKRCREIEDSLPQLVEWLKSLSHRPSLQAQVIPIVDAARAGVGGGHRDVGDVSRLTALAAMIQADLGSDEEERIVPLVALGVACFMGGFTIAHVWGR